MAFSMMCAKGAQFPLLDASDRAVSPSDGQNHASNHFSNHPSELVSIQCCSITRRLCSLDGERCNSPFDHTRSREGGESVVSLWAQLPWQVLTRSPAPISRRT